MPSVTFCGGEMNAAFQCEYQPGGEPTVLELARRHQLPLYWRCGLGTCGTCAVRLTVTEGPLRPIDSKERNVLAREGKPVEQGWRLACGYWLSGETLKVEW